MSITLSNDNCVEFSMNSSGFACNIISCIWLFESKILLANQWKSSKRILWFPSLVNKSKLTKEKTDQVKHIRTYKRPTPACMETMAFIFISNFPFNQRWHFQILSLSSFTYLSYPTSPPHHSTAKTCCKNKQR